MPGMRRIVFREQRIKRRRNSESYQAVDAMDTITDIILEKLLASPISNILSILLSFAMMIVSISDARYGFTVAFLICLFYNMYSIIDNK